MTSLSETLKYIGSGALGAAATYGLTWVRERRRTLDAYRAPQRQAISEILTATHALMMCELEKRTRMTEMIEQIRKSPQQEDPGVPGEQLEAAMRGMGEQLMAAEVAMGNARLSLDRAFAIGTLTIVDARCWEAMGAAYLEFEQLRLAIQSGAKERQTVEEIEEHVRTIGSRASQLNNAVSALVVASQDRVSPAETFWNPWRRRRATRRLGSLYQRMRAGDTPDEPPEPHY